MGFVKRFTYASWASETSVGTPSLSGNEVAAGYEEQEDSEGGESTDEGELRP